MKRFVEKLIKPAKNFFRSIKRDKKVWSGENPTDYPIVYAFTWDGVDYFCYENPLGMPWIRAFVAFEFLEEFNMRITKDLLLNVIAAMKKEIDSPTPRITELVKYLNFLEDRTTWVVEADTLLKIASVHYFTEEESPVRYDVAYNNKKIAKWRESNVLDFFLQLPIKELTPFLSMEKETIRTYFVGQIGKTLRMIEDLQGVLSQSESDDSKLKELQRLKQHLEELMSGILVS